MSDKKKPERPVVSDYDDPEKILRHLDKPEPRLLRIRAIHQALAGEYKKTECPHPLSRIGQFVDDTGSVVRPEDFVNMFECHDCHSLLWLSDPYGKDAADR